MNSITTLLPHLIKRLPAGIQALIFADKFIDWRNSYNLLSKEMPILDYMSPTSFLKLSFIKYAFGMSIKETLESILNRKSFCDYTGIETPSNFLSADRLQSLVYFTSPFGRLAELIEQVDKDLARHNLHLERKRSRRDFKLIPHLAYKNDSEGEDFLAQGIAVWL